MKLALPAFIASAPSASRVQRVINLAACLMCAACNFAAPMVASPLADGKYWVLKTQLVYQDPTTGTTYTVPRGFVTDLASVPRLFWSVFPTCGPYTAAAVVHDYLYWTQSDNCDKSCADKVLLDAMVDLHVSSFSRQAIYTAVDNFGKSSWTENAQLKAVGEFRCVPERFMSFSATDTWEAIQRRVQAAGPVDRYSVECR
jgi:hypothetical protein